MCLKSEPNENKNFGKMKMEDEVTTETTFDPAPKTGSKAGEPSERMMELFEKIMLKRSESGEEVTVKDALRIVGTVLDEIFEGLK